MAVNLIRNSRVFFTTNVDSQGRVRAGSYKDDSNPFLITNTFEIQVLEGMSFSQNTTVDTVTLNEAGATPARGQRSFNTALEAADFSFSTYLRPYLNPGTDNVLGTGTDDYVTCEEKWLWNAFGGSIAVGNTNAAWTNGTPSNSTPAAPGIFTVANSNKHQLQTFGLIIVFDDLAYAIDNCALDTATIDFGIDAIAAIQWAGKGSLIRQLTLTAGQATSGEVLFAGADVTTTPGNPADKALAKNTAAKFITNKLTVLQVNDVINNFTGSDYTVPITGGSITMSNNLTYLTPANLGVVNLPITYFTGTRSITGTLTAYLRTGSTQTGGLLSSLLATAATEINPSYAINIQMGGTSGTHVDVGIPAAMLQIPTVNTEQVISTTLTFTAQGWSGTEFLIDSANEATVKYYATA
jgi:hypothetical protein